MTSTTQRESAARRLLTGAVAGAAALTATLAGAAPAAADPPYAKPDLDITTCGVYDDPVDYGDGIDWWFLSYIFTNEGYTASGPFLVKTEPVWRHLQGNTVTHYFIHDGLGSGQSDFRRYWVTRDVALNHLWQVRVDSNADVSESDEFDNICAHNLNPT
ncbi:hypothetical protein WEI85_38415 [Actinomycetes bacterium KLBMP 9797]